MLKEKTCDVYHRFFCITLVIIKYPDVYLLVDSSKANFSEYFKHF